MNGLNQLTQAGPLPVGHDGRGNIGSIGADTFQYDHANRMTGASRAGVNVTLGYDALDRLYQVGGTRFLYDGADLIAEYNSSGTLLRRFVHGPAEDEPIVWYEGTGTGNRRWLHPDERGSIVAVTDVNGNPIGINRYDEYGVPASANIGRFQYTGQAWLPELGLYHYKARMYWPEGRFMQPDPIGYDDGMNIYAYVGNDPMNGWDPSGTCNKTGPCANDIVITGRRLDYRETNQNFINRENLLWAGRQALSFGLGFTPAGTALDIGTLITGRDLITGERVSGVARFAGVIPGVSELRKTGKGIGAAARTAGCGCFEAGTLVATPEGLVPIETIGIGDLVLAQNEATGEMAPKPVTGLIRPEPKPLYALTLRDASGEIETFHATDDHPWKVEGKGWVETQNLRPEDRIDTASGADMVLLSTELTTRVEHTYNLEVADWHTFMVGEDQAVVHNACNPFKGKTPAQIDKMFKAKGFEPRGPDPLNGKGGYVNPRTGRSYHIDQANRFGEPPHVDVNRPRGYDTLPKRKYGM